MEMDLLSERVVMTGGVVAYNPYLITMMESLIHRPVRVPEHPQLTGALGAALFALETSFRTEGSISKEQV
jgi:activator of 2-hydroxyglutaryl-CoA dehydratase